MEWVTAAIGFAGLWLWAFYQEDRYEHEPLRMLACALAWGIAAFAAALWLEGHLLPAGLLAGEDRLPTRAAGFLLVVGPVEECCKFAGVRLHLWRRPAFNEPMDGIVYAAAAAIGFALAENLYLMVDQPAVILARGPAGTFAHILFAGFWGSVLGWAKRCASPWRRQEMIGLGLLCGATAHGLFDLLWASAGSDLPVWATRLLLLLLTTGCYGLLHRQMVRACTASPFRAEAEAR